MSRNSLQRWIVACTFTVLLTTACEHNGSYSVVCRSLNLSEIPAPESRDIKLLEVSGSQLTSLPAGCFQGYPSLTRLFLHGNKICRVEENAFVGLVDLRVLDLSDNSITRLHAKTFTSNVELDQLSLRGNSLDLSDSNPLLVSETITKLDLRKCNLTGVSDNSFDGLGNLETLNLAHNSLQHLPKRLFESLPKLKAIYLAGNPWRCDGDFEQVMLSKQDVVADYKKVHCVTSDGEQHVWSQGSWKTTQNVASAEPWIQEALETSVSDVAGVVTSSESLDVEDSAAADDADSLASGEDSAAVDEVDNLEAVRIGVDSSETDVVANKDDVVQGDVISDTILYMNVAVIVVIVLAAGFFVFLQRRVIEQCLLNSRDKLCDVESRGCQATRVEVENSDHSNEPLYEAIGNREC